MGKKLTIEGVKKFVEIESNSGCKLLETTIINSKEKMKFKCNCGNIFYTNWNGFKRENKRQCNDCAKEIRRKKKTFSFDYVKNFIKNNSKCKLLSTEYINQTKKLKIECGCGETFETTFDSFKNSNKRQCDKCGQKRTTNARKLKYEDVYRFISKNGCKLLSNKYINQYKELEIRCNCGKIFYTSYTNFKSNNKRRCGECSSELRSQSKRLNIDKIYEYIENKTDCKPLFDEYKNQKQKLKFKCKCGNEFETTWKEFYYQGKQQCNKCGEGLRIRHKTKTNKEFKKEVFNQIKNEYIFLEEYKGVKNKIKVKHNKCNNIYEVTPDNFLNNKRRCPYCEQSKGERIIEDFLIKNNTLYKKEYEFKNLVGIGGNPLRYDFAIFDNKEITKLKCLIEYDGEFHFKKMYKEQNFETQQIHDKRKNKYCIDNNIKLIRIPYWEFDNIESILNKIFKKNNILKEAI